MISRRKRVRFSKLPPYLPGACAGAEKFVAEIAVAMLDVDEIEAEVVGDAAARCNSSMMPLISSSVRTE